MVQLGHNQVQVLKSGTFYYESSSLLIPSLSASAEAQKLAITCSADSGNNLATTSSLSGYFTIPLISASSTLISPILNVIYTTGSIFAASESNKNIYIRPTSSVHFTNYNIYVEIEKNDSANTVAKKTYDQLTGSVHYIKHLSGNYEGNDKIFINNRHSCSLDLPFFSASGFNYNIIQSGSFGSGSGRVNYTPPRGFMPTDSASLAIIRDTNDTQQNSFIFRVQSTSFGGTEHRNFMYVSASENKVGFGTTDPKSGFDFKTHTFKIRSTDGRREVAFDSSSARLISKKYAGAGEDKSSVATETTGSEIVLSYSPGTFQSPITASVNDVLGTITWQDLSISNGGDATAMRIQGIVGAVSTAGDSLKGKMVFGVGSSTAGEPVKDVLETNFEGIKLLSSSKFTLESGSLNIGDNQADDDREILFWQDTSAKRFILGVDNSRSRFVIHQGRTSFPSSGESFAMDTDGNIEIGQNLTVSGHMTASGIVSQGNISASGNIHGFTGSFQYITASVVDVDADTIRVGGETMNKVLIQNVKDGFDSTTRTSTGKGASFKENITVGTHVTASGNILTSAGNVLGSNVGEIHDNKIYLRPSDFFAPGNTDTRNPFSMGGNGAYLQDGGTRFEYIAQKYIPKGYQAISASVFGNTSSETFTIYSSSYSASDAGLAAHPARFVNTASAIVEPIKGGGMYCSINWTSGGGTRIYGGYIQLELTRD